MDCNKYFLNDKTKYTVHFHNAAELSLEEIRDIFSPFGNIVNISCSGDKRGMRFVSYATVKETIECIKNLKGHKLIKLLPERAKLKNEGNKKKVQHKKQSNEASQFDRSIINKQEAVKEVTCYDEQNDNVDSENNESSFKSFDIRSTSSKSTKLFMKSNIISTKDRNKSLNNSNTPLDSGSSSQEDNETYISQIPSLIRADRSIESLHECSSSTSSIINPRICIAQDIVVANIHKNYSIHYILHLFHKFNPIAVSPMKKISGTEIQYCHVYFKNLQHALHVEQKFDNYPLDGKCLIVARSHRLLQEAMM